MEKLLSDPKILNLPWATLVTMACGYIGYFIANVGVRDHHKPIDVAFSVLVYGFVAAFAYQISRRLDEDMLLSAVFAAAVAFAAGAVWRVLGREWLRKSLRLGDISHADDFPSAWVSLFSQTSVRATELSVKLKDGTVLLCQDMARFADKPNGPFVFGANGDILMYVTSQKKPGAEDWQSEDDVEYPEWGAVITYIPATEINRVRFRRK